MTSSSTLSDKSILYLEDEIIVAIEIGEILGDLGFGEVLVAHNLRSAETLLAGRGVDFALLDVNLGNGERSNELGMRLAASGTDVIFASGYNKGELAPEMQVFSFLEKPVTAQDIRRAIFAKVEAAAEAATAGKA